jgi:pre-rRNA-processing protein IPI3
MRTYLLPDVPTAAVLDPADRGFYVAYEDGSLQTIDFYDESQHATASDILRDRSQSHRPLQPSPKTRYNAESQKLGGALSLSLSWDSTTLISGHVSGKVASWDIASRNYVSTLTSLPGPVTNLQFLAPAGFPNTTEPKFSISTVVKPKQDSGLSSVATGLVPPNYNLNMQFTSRVSVPTISATEKKTAEKTTFEEALTHPSFPLSMLEESLAELESWNVQPKSKVAPAADFLALDAADDAAHGNGNEEEVLELKSQLASLQRIQKVTFQQLSELREEKEWFVKKEKKRAAQKKLRHMRNEGPVNGKAGSESEVEMNSDGSSSTESEGSDDGDKGSEDVESDDEGVESK